MAVSNSSPGKGNVPRSRTRRIPLLLPPYPGWGATQRGTGAGISKEPFYCLEFFSPSSPPTPSQRGSTAASLWDSCTSRAGGSTHTSDRQHQNTATPSNTDSVVAVDQTKGTTKKMRLALFLLYQRSDFHFSFSICKHI